MLSPSACHASVRTREQLSFLRLGRRCGRLVGRSGTISFLSCGGDLVAGLDLVERHAAVDRLAHQRVIVRDGAERRRRPAPARCRSCAGRRRTCCCSKRLTMTCGCGPSPSRSLIAATSCLAWLQARHRRLADDEQLVRAEQHAVGPGEPGARHVDHDIVEMRWRRDRAAASPRRDRRCAFRPAGSARRSRPGRRHDSDSMTSSNCRSSRSGRGSISRVRAAARGRDSRRQAPCWKSRSTRQVDGLRAVRRC